MWIFLWDFLRISVAPSRNILSNKSIIVDYTEDLITGIDFDTKIYLFVKPRLSMKNFDFSNRQRFKQLVNKRTQSLNTIS